MSITIKEKIILSDDWNQLFKIKFETNDNGRTETISREVYRPDDGVTVLLYNSKTKNIILTRQLRIASFLNGNNGGYLIETCAGILDEKNAEEGIKREIKEETGCDIPEVKKIFEAYMSPGTVSERLHFYIAEYSMEMKNSPGGGLDDEHEHIDVLELPFKKALDMIITGEIRDGKTIILLQYAALNLEALH